MKKAVVIGGGLAGLFAASLLIKKGFKVNIVESANQLGGLISSVKFKDYYFDHGSHIAQETINKNVNKVLFKNSKKNFLSYKYLPQNHYFNDKWYNKSPFLNITHLKKENYLKAFSQILREFNFDKKNFKNENDRCKFLYGSFLTKHVFEPLIKKKTGFKLSNLPTKIKDKFNLSKIIIGKSKITNKLKESEYYNNILAFNSYKKGVTGRKNLYPKKKGINNLIHLFLTKNFLSNVEISLNENIKSAIINKSKIKSLKTNKRILHGDVFIWTGNIKSLNSVLLKIKNKNYNKKYYWNFFHYLSDRPLEKNIFYSYIYDKDSPIHRITYYDNFQKKIDKKKKFRITVEYITPNKILTTEIVNKEILNYLKKIKILKKDNKLFLVKDYSIPMSIEAKKTKIDKKLLKFQNLFICGQVSGEYSKQNIVLDIYDKVSQI
tara:strand:+ start:1252 stop:2556 length:1305 start_codon:yes stop_codon:yes gene_type:complete